MDSGRRCTVVSRLLTTNLAAAMTEMRDLLAGFYVKRPRGSV